MKAIGYDRHLPIDDPQSLFDFELPTPTASGHDLLVKIDAVSVNPVDIAVRTNSESLTSPKVIGWDAVGIVTEVGNQVTLFKQGDRVFYAGSFIRPGSNSEYQLVDERIVGLAPKKLDDAHAAAMPLTALTAWEALFEQLGIDFNHPEANKGKVLLINNGAGGVGSIATQLAHLAGLTVIASASRPATIDWVIQHGADQTVDHHKNFVTEVRDLGYEYIDYILDLKGLDQHWSEFAELIAPNGKIVSITGSKQPLDLNILKEKRATFAFEWMYTKSKYQTDDMISQHEILTKISQLLDNGMIKSTLTETLSPINAENLRKAHTLVESNQMIGKVVVTNN
ncbi:zinc-binding alcohol dehydrogenase family protein [Lentilactobacillus kosonis]|uniref:Zinc-type alcohol dehydrogenase-like protein n=1 Tax=Lentilactobacillus kosonis TaxID=2810561 RepID=A0A401FJE5_9LACO|nr:zinc-binding alcohol dehydrogenase family protein [Lentilactobacillus kosonis]GAY72494.1 bifunctional protein: zinc-containing alcohol dehydrogenase, quinone oxidoreductase [Lentilactobacillus kosonis]